MLNDIIKGHVNEALGNNGDLSAQRMAICKACPLMKESVFGPVCNSALYLNKDTNETSLHPKVGFQRGCGCRLNAKTRLEGAHCPLNKW